MRLATLAILPALAFAAPALAAEPWVLDKSHAHVSFSADHLGFSVVQGQFRTFDAEILFNPDDIGATQLTFTIDAASVDTFWPDRDKHIRSADFLNVEKHPTITFKSTKVEKTSDTTAKVSGDLTMIGATHPVTFDVTLNKIGPSPFQADKTIAGFTATGEIVRATWGMSYGGEAFAARIPVRVDLEMSPAK